MAQTLTDLVVTEISLVDAPANPGAVVTLYKRGEPIEKYPTPGLPHPHAGNRHGSGRTPRSRLARQSTNPKIRRTPTAHRSSHRIKKDQTMDAAAEAYLKRDFSADDRKRLAGSGAAMPDGSYPIENVSDLENAIRAIGRAKDPAKAKSHIKSRAKALGATDKLPDTWSGAKALLAKPSDFLFAEAEKDETADAEDLAEDMLGEITGMAKDLRTSVAEILADTAIVNKGEAIDESIEQFEAALADESIAKILIAKLAAASGEEGDDPMSEEMTKALAAKDAEIAKLTADLATSAADLVKAKKKPSTDDGKDDGKPEPDEDDMKKALAAMPAALRKRLEDGEAIAKAQADVISKLTETNEMALFEKRAAAAGFAPEAAAHMRSIAKADPKALDYFESLVKGKNEQIKLNDRLSKELGHSGAASGDGTAAGDLLAKAEELAKRDNISKVSAKARLMKADPDLASRVLAEEMRNRHH